MLKSDKPNDRHREKESIRCGHTEAVEKFVIHDIFSWNTQQLSSWITFLQGSAGFISTQYFYRELPMERTMYLYLYYSTCYVYKEYCCTCTSTTAVVLIATDVLRRSWNGITWQSSKHPGWLLYRVETSFLGLSPPSVFVLFRFTNFGSLFAVFSSFVG